MPKIDNKTRKNIETLIYQVFDALDKTQTNSDHYKELFSKMSNDQFYSYISKDFPYRFYDKPFVIKTTMSDVVKALDILNVPLMEKVSLPYLYKDKDGVAVTTQECMTCYIPLKKVKQFLNKKNSYGISLAKRDMKTGLLTSDSKSGKLSDREAESLEVLGLDKTMIEFSRPKADSMKAKDLMYNIISQKGQVSQDEIPIDQDDSLAKNLLNVYMVGSLLNSNLINQDYYLPATLANKKKVVTRL